MFRDLFKGFALMFIIVCGGGVLLKSAVEDTQESGGLKDKEIVVIEEVATSERATSSLITTTTTTTTHKKEYLVANDLLSSTTYIPVTLEDPKEEIQLLCERETIFYEEEQETVEQEIEIEEEETEPAFYYYNENSKRVHTAECKYSDDSMERIYGDYIEHARPCLECNPSIYIETLYEEEQLTEENNEVAAEVESSNYLGNFKITGYVATGNPTSTGVMPYVGGVAMSTAHGVPYGTTLYIEGLGYYTVNDTGCSYGTIDVFCNSEQECYNITQYAEVYIIN